MHQLINWLGAEREKIKRVDKNAQLLVIVAFDFHLRFLTIHPFHDGNGRAARLLSNLLLIAHGYPPFYITDEEKDTYNRYLTDIQGYGGGPDLFYEFMAGLVARSLQLTLNVIEGRDDDQNDWTKKLRLLKTSLPTEQNLYLKKAVQDPFDIRLELRWGLDDYTYSFGFREHGDSPGLTRYYHQYYSAEEINTIISQSGDLLVKQIEEHLEGLNPR